MRGGLAAVVGSVDPVGRAAEPVVGSFEPGGGSAEQVGGSGDVVGGSVEPVVGSFEPGGGSAEQVGGSADVVGGSVEPVGGSGDVVGGSVEPVVGSFEPGGGSADEVGGSADVVDGSVHHVVGSFEPVGGSAGSVGGSGERVGGLDAPGAGLAGRRSGPDGVVFGWFSVTDTDRPELSRMAKLIIEITGRIVLVVHAGGAFSPEEWRSIVAVARRPDLSDLRCVVYDHGGAVDSAQRRELVEAMAGRMPKAAVLTGSRVSRGITTAIGWFQPAIKPFAPDRFDDAADHLGLTPEEREAARKAVRRISAQVGLRSIA